MSRRRTELNVDTVHQLVAGGMDPIDAPWLIETNNMVVKTFHGNADYAFQESDPGVKERYLRLLAHAKTILSKEQEPFVLAFQTDGESTQQVVCIVDEAVRRLRIGVSHYGDTPKGNQMLAAEGRRIAEAVGLDSQVPVISRISQMVDLPPEDRALVERALALSAGKSKAAA